MQIFQNFDECPLESLSVKVTIQNEQEILALKDLISKKKITLKRVKFWIIKEQGIFISRTLLEELSNVVDNLPQLTSFYFLLRASQPRVIPLEYAFPFKKLFEKPIPLRKFQHISNQLSFSLNILNSLQGVAGYLEKLQIDIGNYEPQSPTESDILCEFLRSLVNIQVLKLGSLRVSKQNFSKIIEAILSLRYLTDLTIGQFAEEIPQETLIKGVEKILGKYGFRNFEGSVVETPFLNSGNRGSDPFVQLLFGQKREEIPHVDLTNIKRKNPYLQDYPKMLLSSRILHEENW